MQFHEIDCRLALNKYETESGWSTAVTLERLYEGESYPCFPFETQPREGRRARRTDYAGNEDAGQSGVKTSSLVIYFPGCRGVKVLKFH